MADFVQQCVGEMEARRHLTSPLTKPLRGQVLPSEAPGARCRLVPPGLALSPMARRLHFSSTGFGVLTGGCSWARRIFFLHVGLLQAIAAPASSAWRGFSLEPCGKNSLACRIQADPWGGLWLLLGRNNREDEKSLRQRRRQQYLQCICMHACWQPVSRLRQVTNAGR